MQSRFCASYMNGGIFHLSCRPAKSRACIDRENRTHDLALIDRGEHWVMVRHGLKHPGFAAQLRAGDAFPRKTTHPTSLGSALLLAHCGAIHGKRSLWPTCRLQSCDLRPMRHQSRDNAILLAERVLQASHAVR